MSDKHLRILVERLILGDVRIKDLQTLLSALRHRTFGSAPYLKELGDAIAHFETRDKGVVSAMLSDLFLFAGWKFAHLQVVDLSDLPKDFPDILRANLRLTFKNDHHDKSKLGPILKRFEQLPSGKYGFAGLTEKHLDHLHKIMDHLGGWPALTADDLHQDFCKVIVKNKLATDDESAALQVRDWLALLFISVLHGCNVMLEDRDAGTLLASVHDGIITLDGSITVIAGEPKPVPIAVHFTMFNTDLKAEEYCLPELLGASGTRWEDLVIELSEDKKLRQLKADQ